jgi:hypothetical protein
MHHTGSGRVTLQEILPVGGGYIVEELAVGGHSPGVRKRCRIFAASSLARRFIRAIHVEEFPWGLRFTAVYAQKNSLPMKAHHLHVSARCEAVFEMEDERSKRGDHGRM